MFSIIFDGSSPEKFYYKKKKFPIPSSRSPIVAIKNGLNDLILYLFDNKFLKKNFH